MICECSECGAYKQFKLIGDNRVCNYRGSKMKIRINSMDICDVENFVFSVLILLLLFLELYTMVLALP